MSASLVLIDQICIETIVQNVKSINNITDLFHVTIDIMEFYERFRRLTGSEKMDKVRKMILLVLLSHAKEEDKRQFYQDITPLIIELVIEISKRKKLLINMIEKAGCSSCFPKKNVTYKV